MKIVQRTDIGLRQSNDDTCLIEHRPDCALIAVSDGMGGHAAGKTASTLTIATLRDSFATDEPMASDFLAQAVAASNQIVWQAQHGDPALLGMGATLVAAVLWPDSYEAVNVGDSRLYHYVGGRLEQITRDHSYVGELVRLGILTPESAAVHPRRNVILRAVGSEAVVSADTFSGLWAEGDLLLLCSDGLHGFVPDADILEKLTPGRPLEEIAEELIALALAQGARDNISVVLALHDGESL